VFVIKIIPPQVTGFSRANTEKMKSKNIPIKIRVSINILDPKKRAL
jgi:hypothetical protein